MLSLVLGCDGF